MQWARNTEFMTPQAYGSEHLAHGKLHIPPAYSQAGGIGRLNESTQQITYSK